MKAKIIAILALLVVVGAAVAQKDKKWTEWNKKEAQKMLEDSPWAKTQNETDTTEGFFQPTSQKDVNGAGKGVNEDERTKQGAANQSSNVKYFVRFLSARPIREALIRTLELNNSGADAATVARWHQYADARGQDSNTIIVTVGYQGGQGCDRRCIGPVEQAFNSAVSGTLKNKTYLQRSDGKQLFLEKYIPPGKDGFGAQFVFVRMPDEKAFIDANNKEVRFYSEVSSSIKIDRRFRIADMMFEGELEY